MQLHYPGARFREDGDYPVTLNPGDKYPFAVIELSDDGRTFFYAEEADVDRLIRAAGKAKALFEDHRRATICPAVAERTGVTCSLARDHEGRHEHLRDGRPAVVWGPGDDGWLDRAAAPEPDPADAMFLPERATELLSWPPLALDGRRGEVVRKMQVLFRDGLTQIGGADRPDLVDAVSENRARIIRTWDLDWTADKAVAVNEVQFTGHQSVPVDPAEQADPGYLEDAAAADESVADDPFIATGEDEPCGAKNPASGWRCYYRKGHEGQHKSSSGTRGADFSYWPDVPADAPAAVVAVQDGASA